MKEKNTIAMNNQNEVPDEGNSMILEVPQMLFDDLRNGILKHIDIPIHLNSYSTILENIDGNLILNCDEVPESFFACYFWNNGVFPYWVKDSLKYIIFQNEGRSLTMKITGHSESAVERCDFLEDDTLKTNPKGNACVWNIRFDVELLDSQVIGNTDENIPSVSMTPQNEKADKKTKKSRKEDRKFDPDQGHGSHWECVVEDIENVTDDLFKVITSSKNYIGDASIKANDDNGEYDAKILSMSLDESKDLTIRTLLEAGEDGNFFRSAFPYVMNETGVPMTLTKIYEFSNGIEAVLCCDYKDEMEFRFFDADYPLHKTEYKIGETYNFALSAIAYNAEKVPDSEMSFEIDPETVEKMHRSAPSVVRRDSNGKALPMKMSMEMFVTCLQHDDRYPDDAEFWSPVKSKVRKTKLLGRDFYRMEISVHHNEEDENLIIPLVAKTSFFDEKPSKGDAVRGYLWLQGRRIVKTSSQFEKDPHNYPGNGYNDKQQTFILMWNPAFSNSMENHIESIGHINDYSFNWSVYEWEKAKMGDRFYMIRVGEGNTGVVMSGIFTSQPYADEDWDPNRNRRKIHYMDMKPNFIVNPEEQTIITTEQLQEVIPDFEWRRGHSGQLLNPEQAKKLEILFSKYVQKMLNVDDKTNVAISNIVKQI